MEKQIAWGLFNIKAMDEEKREFSGIASTPEPDRVEDIMVPEGAKFNLPLPFLWQHDHLQPIGEIYEAKVTAKGIEVKGRIKKASSPSQLAARLDEAWVSIREGLVRGLSIGFKPIKYAFLDSGGMQFDEWDWYELSAVTVPANAQGQITSVKSLKNLDQETTSTAQGKKTVSKSDVTSGVSEKNRKTVKLPKTKDDKMNLSEKLKGFETELSKLENTREELVTKQLDAGETFDEAEKEELSQTKSKIKELREFIAETKELIEDKKKTAKAVEEKSGHSEAKSFEVRSNIQVKAAEKLEKGIEFARYTMCMVAAKGNAGMALDLAKTHYGNNERVIKALEFQRKGGKFEGMMKASVEAGTTLDETWAAPLVDYQNFAGDFVEYLRPQTILGQFGTSNIPALNRIPFNVRITGQTSGGSAYWVGEGAPKPLTAFDFTATELRWNKIAAISVITEELIRFSNPAAERLVRDGLASSVIERMDIDFIDPTKAASTNVSPASITNGVTPIVSSGNDADSVRQDIQALWAPFIAANNPPRSAVYIMDSTTALSLSMMQNALGQPEFAGLTMNGGTLGGVPVIVSDYLPVDSAGHMVILVNARDVWLADDGQVTIDASREASLQMLDNPTNNSATATATSMVSMFQTNSVALRAERYINWAKRRSTGVQYLSGVNWGGVTA